MNDCFQTAGVFQTFMEDEQPQHSAQIYLFGRTNKTKELG